MKIVAYNIQFGPGKDGQNDPLRIAQAVGGADIIALQEFERNWQSSGHVDQPEILASYLPNYYWVYGPNFDVDSGQKNAHRQFDNMTLSKSPILSTRLFPLPKTGNTARRSMANGMQEAVIVPGSKGALRVYNTDLSAKSAPDRISQIKRMRRVISDVPAEGGAWTGHSPDPLWQEGKNPPPMPEEFVLLGDFNYGSNAPEYTDITQPDSDGNAMIDCWTLTGNHLNEGVTFPTKNPENSDRIDFAFVDHTLKDRVTKTWIDVAAQGSDHQPFWIEINDA